MTATYIVYTYHIFMKRFVLVISIFVFLMIASPVLAVTPVRDAGVVNPSRFLNNRFGIHILEANDLDKAAFLVNSSGGEWGYVTMVIRSDDRKVAKWQTFMRRARELKLIPILRLATVPEGNAWKKPREEDAKEWAIFLNRLAWPVKNRYVVVYNEPNHALEWGNDINPGEYARVLKATRDELKTVNPDFFVLNAGFDSSAPNLDGYSMGSLEYMAGMEKEVPGIFKLIDGWASHSYPNPEFSGRPTDSGLTSIRGFEVELGVLASRYGVSNLPVFITETGWKHAVDGDAYGFLSEERVTRYYRDAFSGAWNDSRIVAVTPFVMGYFQEPFLRFSFLKVDGSHYAPYDALATLLKPGGSPAVNAADDARFVVAEVPSILYTGKKQDFVVYLKNTGTTTWFMDEGYELIGKSDSGDYSFKVPFLDRDEVVQPGETRAFRFSRVAPRQARAYKFYWQMSKGGAVFGEQGTSDLLVQSAVIVFDKEYRYHVEGERAVLEATDEPIVLYKPRILPGSPLYGMKEVVEGVRPWFISEAEERDIQELSLLETRLAETAALTEKNNETRVTAALFELAHETERAGNAFSLDPTPAQLYVMKAELVKQQYTLGRLSVNASEQTRSSFEDALFTSQRALKKVVDMETALALTASLN